MQLRSVKSKLHNLPLLLSLRVGRRFNLEGIKLVVFLQGRDRAELLRAKVAGALRLIQEHTPKHYARVHRHMPNILIFGAHAYNAVYFSDLKLCDISRHYALLEKTSASRLAMTLVHEATHGYLISKGIAYEEHRRGRIEAVCIRAEIAFARRLPDTSTLIEQAASQLNIASEFWKNEAFFERDLDQLRNLGAPQWFVAYLRNKRARRTHHGKEDMG